MRKEYGAQAPNGKLRGLSMRNACRSPHTLDRVERGDGAVHAVQVRLLIRGEVDSIEGYGPDPVGWCQLADERSPPGLQIEALDTCGDLPGSEDEQRPAIR